MSTDDKGHKEEQGVIRAYILAQDAEKQDDLNLIYTLLKEILPDAEEKISWRMPTFWKGYNIIHFAAFKNHIGLYPGPDAIEAFSASLKGYKHSKGAIQIPYGKIDKELIQNIAKWCLETGHHA